MSAIFELKKEAVRYSAEDVGQCTNALRLITKSSLNLQTFESVEH